MTGSSSNGSFNQIALPLVTLLANPWIMALLVFCSSLALMLLIGGPLVKALRLKRWRRDNEASWTVREDTPDTHQAKQGTPSMGGLGIIGSAVATIFAFIMLDEATIALAGSTGFTSWTAPEVMWISLLPLTTVAFCCLGFADDWSKATGRGGLRARSKFAMQVVLAIGFLVIFPIINITMHATRTQLGLTLPLAALDVLSRLATPEFLFAFLLLIIFLVGTCNAVNLTDGLDGLAAGLTITAALALAICRPDFTYSQFGASLWNLALAGACLGFLAFNKYPARVFMGDTGSLAIGAALGVAAIMSGTVWLLPFVGFMFYVEMFSVIAQVLWFKWTKKTRGQGVRLFRRAPLHHHFELAGWSEWRVVLTFWLINLCTASLGVTLWHMGKLQ